MKYLILLVAAFGLACSTAKKNTTDTTAQKPAETKAAATQTTEKKEETKAEAKAKKVKKGAKAAATEAAAAGEVKCKSGSDERSIAVEKTDSGCETKYTKAGETKSIAKGKADLKHCQEAADKIRKNLEGAGYTCQ